jgi:hypothetical protein
MIKQIKENINYKGQKAEKSYAGGSYFVVNPLAKS